MKKLPYILICFFVLIGSASATTYYICESATDCNAGDGSGWGTGSDSANGTAKATPWATFSKANAEVSGDDIVVVGDGTYEESYNAAAMIHITADGSDGHWITYKAENKYGAILDATGVSGEDSMYAFFIDEASYVRFEDFHIQNVIGGYTIFNNGAPGHVYIYRNKMHDLHFVGVIVNEQGSEYTTIDSCLFYNIEYGDYAEDDWNRYTHNHAMYLKGKYNLAINNIIYDNFGGFAIKIDGYDNASEFVGAEWTHRIINNVFHGFTGTAWQSGMIDFYNSSGTYTSYNVSIENNVFLDPPDGKGGIIGIQVGLANNTCTNSSHWDPDTLSINNNAINKSILLRDCLNQYVSSYANNATSIVANNNLTDYASHDYTLLPIGSDLIDKGLATNAPDLDFNGTARPIGAADDIGAYERQSGPIISLTSPIGLQACGYSGVITVESTLNSNCNYEDSATGSCSDDYTSLGVGGDPFTGGEAGTTHTVTVANTCDTSTTYIVICEDSSTAEDSNCIEVNMNIAAETGSPQPTPVSIVGGGSAGIVGGGNVTMY